jgi:hypothetical protein
LVGSASPATGARSFPRCSALNKVHPHGVGLPWAHDKVSGNTKKVTNFTKNAGLYHANDHLDRDNDRIACEQL